VSASIQPQEGSTAPAADQDQSLALEERRRRILGLIQDRAQVTVGELAERFAVSAVTIRSD
jgi:DeoR family transcriptional regulator of aga operon